MIKGSNYPKRIRNSIITYYLTSIVVMLTLLGCVLYFLNKRHLQGEMGKRLIAIASMTASDLTPWLLTQLHPGAEQSRTFELIRSKLVKATSTGQVSRVYIADLEDRSLVDTDPSVKIGMPYYELQLYQKELTKVRNGIPVHTTLFEGKDGVYYKMGFVPIYQDNRLVAVLGVQGSADFFKDLTRMRRYLLYAIFFISLMIIGVGMLISEKIIEPIGKLINATKRIGNGDLQTAVELPYRNEFGYLGASIDDMRKDLLEKENRMKAMLQGIAHEIRNPLGGIELFAGLLGEEISPDKKEQQHGVQKIKDEVQNLKLTIEQFLDYARDSAPQPDWVDAQHFLDDILLSAQLSAREHHVELSGECAPGFKEIWCDKRMMKSVLLNMIQNAIQAIRKPNADRPDGRTDGKVQVKLEPRPHEGRSGFAIKVRDNGAGIPSEDLPNLFRPFFTTKEKGCGLGLAFCHKIVHSHGGHIRVDSAPNEGTTMYIWLPPPNRR